jgi:hypothetical protein
MRKGGFPSAVKQFGDAGAVSVTMIRISTCDFWATNKGSSRSSTRCPTPSWRRIGSRTSGANSCPGRVPSELGHSGRETRFGRQAFMNTLQELLQLTQHSQISKSGNGLARVRNWD